MECLLNKKKRYILTSNKTTITIKWTIWCWSRTRSIQNVSLEYFDTIFDTTSEAFGIIFTTQTIINPCVTITITRDCVSFCCCINSFLFSPFFLLLSPFFLFLFFLNFFNPMFLLYFLPFFKQIFYFIPSTLFVVDNFIKGTRTSSTF